MRPAKLKKTLFSQNQLLRYFWPEWLGMRCVRSCVPTVRLWTKGESASQQVSGSRCMHLWFPTLRAERHSPKNGAPDLRGDAYFAKYKKPSLREAGQVKTTNLRCTHWRFPAFRAEKRGAEDGAPVSVAIPSAKYLRCLLRQIQKMGSIVGSRARCMQLVG
jgi:hypothetical protein